MKKNMIFAVIVAVFLVHNSSVMVAVSNDDKVKHDDKVKKAINAAKINPAINTNEYKQVTDLLNKFGSRGVDALLQHLYQRLVEGDKIEDEDEREDAIFYVLHVVENAKVITALAHYFDLKPQTLSQKVSKVIVDSGKE